MILPILLALLVGGSRAHIPLEENSNYIWITGHWETCVPKSSNTDYCGYGVKSRKIECIDSKHPKGELLCCQTRIF